jgi:hypothetical protein
MTLQLTARWKLIVYGQIGIYKNYHPQLFDVDADPLEVCPRPPPCTP